MSLFERFRNDINEDRDVPEERRSLYKIHVQKFVAVMDLYTTDDVTQAQFRNAFNIPSGTPERTHFNRLIALADAAKGRNEARRIAFLRRLESVVILMESQPFRRAFTDRQLLNMLEFAAGEPLT